MSFPILTQWFDLVAQPKATERPSLEERGIALACKIVRDHDEEATPPDVGCYECTLGMVPRAKETGPCLYHAACELIRDAGLEP